MALVNEHFLKLPGSYLFSDIAKKVNTFKITHPKQDIIRLGIGDVTQPLPKACIEAMHKAVEELASKDTFRGYGPEQGYDFLIEAIIKNDFAPRGIHFSASEIFVSDGAKSDTGNIGDILRHDNSVGVTDPIYPVYIYNPQIQISAESETKRSIFREKDKTKRSKKESAQHSKSRNKSFVMTSVSAL